MTTQMEQIHEALGNEYLREMKSHGVVSPPMIVWVTEPPTLGGETIACILWPEPKGEEWVAGYPREFLAVVVAGRVLARLGSGN
jgi:hypothetical protein